MNLYASKITNNLLINDKVINSLSEEISLKIHAYKKESDANRSLYAYLLLNYVFVKELKSSINQLHVSKNYYGKPFLREYPEFHFNLSHSGNWVVCVTNSTPVGIDIEEIKLIDYQSIAEQFFSPEECKLILSAPSQSQLELFYNVWTLKESYVKAIGGGLSIPLDSFTVIGRENENYKVVSLKLKTYELDQNYKLATCISDGDFTSRIQMIEWQDLINLY